MNGGPTAIPSDQLLDALEVSVVVLDRDGHVLLANQRAKHELADLGLASDGRGSVFDFDFDMLDEHGARIDMSQAPSMRTLRTGEHVEGFVLGVREHGSTLVRWILVATRPTHDADGEVSGVVCTFTDITEQRNAQAQLQTSEERFRLIAESAADVVYRFSVGPSPRFDYVNPAVEEALGYLPEDFYDDPELILRVTHPDDMETVCQLGMEGVDDVRSVQVRLFRRDGAEIWTEHKVVPLRDASGAVVAATGIARDVTALKLKEADLNHRALHDPLTGLPNRALMLDRLESALARIRRYPGFLAVLYLDLDRFKTVNDNLGHAAGDRLLQEVAHRLQETLRPSDTVARIGGDEFVAVLADLHEPAEAEHVAGRLLSVIAEPVDLGHGGLVTTVSIGIASAGDGETGAGELLRRADFAMYSAKDRGRAQVASYEVVAREAPS
jgi:diguanylate cyclase (GGDEF)-like protein/PAS domain S-box-containing protein